MEDNSFTDFIEQVKKRNNIVDVASKYITLEKKGANYWACCPLHHETKPSFAINPDRGSYICYGCHEHGDVFKLVQELESCSFMDALKKLAERAGMQMPEFKGGKSNNNSEKKERLYALMRDTALFYHANLYSDDGFAALEYCKARGLSNATIKNFGLGYSKDFDSLVKHLLDKGYKIDEMTEAGVVETKNGKTFDAQHGRLIIPIINKIGKVIAFGGRYLGDTDFAKYKNTCETLIFEKRNEIFGVHTLKKLKISEGFDKVIVVEGYMDVISLYQAGVKNVCASMGTALTAEQCKTLKYLTDNVYLCYDGDSAGQKATLRGIDILMEAGLNVRVVTLQDKLDPDDFIKKYGKDAFDNKIKSAIAPILYKINNIKTLYDITDPDGLSKFTIESLKVIGKLANPVDRNVYLDIVAGYTNIDKSVLIDQMKTDSSVLTTYIKRNESKPDNKYFAAARYVLYSLFVGEEYADIKAIDTEYFDDTTHKDLLNGYRLLVDSGELPTPEKLNELTDNDAECKAIIVTAQVVSDKAKKEYYDSSLAILKKLYFEREKNALNSEYAQTDDHERKAQIVKQIASLTAEMRKNS